MPPKELENLAESGRLKREPATQREIDGLVRLGEAKLMDAKKKGLSLESRFDLAYGAAHAFALSALRWHGFRPDGRAIVFRTLPHTLGLGQEVWRVLDKGHGVRNQSEYEGSTRADSGLVEAIILACEAVHQALVESGPIRRDGQGV
jgi:hypothetical protein